MGIEVYGELINAAVSARNNAYIPYSGFAVGAAVLTEDGNIYSGCNIENSSYGATVCAERTAIFKAVSEGETGISAIAVCGGPKSIGIEQYCMPCGICRQVLAEFAAKDAQVIVARSLDDYKVFAIDELLPCAFKL